MSKVSVLQRSALILMAVCAVYSNHFQNGFHFDDWHTITQNVAIRELSNVPRFFVDSGTMSVLPANQAYRPLVTTSLAIDYWIGGGLSPVAFHASTFCWFLALLGLIFALDCRILEGRAAAALFATAWFGLHPVSAETVNYVVQRADLYVAVGIVAALVIYGSFPGQRKWGFYLLPVILAGLCKPTVVIFPAFLILYAILCESMRPAAALRSAVPPLGVSLLLALLHRAMTPPSFNPAGTSWFEYAITQPRVTLHYFCSWFLPLGLSADTDRRAFTSIWSLEALAGFAFVIALGAIATVCARYSSWRPVAFGLLWFLAALLPTAVMPLAEVENDHRMFLPFIGLSIAVTASAMRLYEWMSSRHRLALPAATRAALCVLILAAYGAGAHARNQVWLNEETLWYDVTQKSPRNGRGLMNYGITQMAKGEYRRALEYFEQALRYTPAYSFLHINIGIAQGALNQQAIAEQHFQKAIQLAPADALPRFHYGQYLKGRGRVAEAVEHLEAAVERNPRHAEAQALLTQARRDTPERYLRLSLASFQAGRYVECIQAAQEALRLRPGYAEAYNNIAAGYQALGQWDEAIEAAQQAIRIRPDFQLARNNLAWSQSRRARANQN